MASSGRCSMDHVPQMQAAATKAKIRNLLRTEKVMRRLIIPRAPFSNLRRSSTDHQNISQDLA